MPEFDVVDLGPADHPEPGATAPDFTRPLVNREFWENRTLSRVAAELDDGERLVLAFTPMVGSFPARYVLDELRERGWHDRATVVAVSISTPYDVAELLRERDYPFEGFSDPGNGVAEAYGIVHDVDGMAGVEEPRPAIFVLDRERTVEAAWVAEEWPAFPDYDELEPSLEGA